MNSARARPIRIAIVNDYELVINGVASILEPFGDAVQVVELDSQVPLVSDVDILLYDTFAAAQGPQLNLDALFAGPVSARVVVYSWNTQPELVAGALQRGAAGYVSKALPADELVEALRRIHAGQVVTPDGAAPAAELTTKGWPGKEHGLSPRESEVVALITQGLTNEEIALKVYLTKNSVKTYIRTAYRKMGVARRSQAVAWGIRNGMSPNTARRLP